MAYTLVLVESPNKVKKIAGFLGQGYRVEASMGHIRDLPPKGGMAIDFSADGRIAPHYEPIPRSRDRVNRLKGMARQADQILVATDPDREGEAIGWHLMQLLGEHQYGRIVFNAITKRAVQDALAQVRNLDDHLVGAQQARRVLDRVVGWVVSPLCKQGVGSKDAKSAGRVQSVALRLVCEREQEIRNFVSQDFFVLTATLQASDPPAFQAKLVEWKGQSTDKQIATAESAEKIRAWCESQREWLITKAERKDQKRRPKPPFITSTIQQAASTRLRLGPKRCMQLLQQLFEGGHITYHRTDSTALSPEAVAMARDHIEAHFEARYLPKSPQSYESKSANAQEAHEAIRPTVAKSGPDAVGGDEAGKLYAIIWKRFIACQMADGIDAVATLEASIGPGRVDHPERGAVAAAVWRARGRMVRFDGWRAVYEDIDDDRGKKTKKAQAEEDGAGVRLPNLNEGDTVEPQKIVSEQKSTRPPPRYSQASLIKRLEKDGIGRPSTYAAIMDTLLARKYIQEKARKLHATPLGEQLCRWLVQHFGNTFLDYAYTNTLEAKLDAIARGEEDWQGATFQACRDIVAAAQRCGLGYDPLAGETRDDADAKAPPCPLCGKGMHHRVSRFGPFFACEDRSCPAICQEDGSPSTKTRKLIDERERGDQS